MSVLENTMIFITDHLRQKYIYLTINEAEEIRNYLNNLFEEREK
jgi:hypothetical protein